MALRAVVFDYGMVLTGPPDPAAHAELQRISGLSAEKLDSYYWADRHAYDEGKLTGMEFWHKIVRDAGLSLSDASVAELNQWDARMWTTQNPAMVAWHARLKGRGLKTAILSNMGDSVREAIELTYDWIQGFDVRVWSYELKMAKPERAIYEYVLAKLDLPAEETLFLDDRVVNIEAAQDVGMKGIVFSDVERLRAELIELGMDKELPLPE